MGSNVLIGKNKKVFITKLNTPSKSNVLGSALRDDLKEALRQFQNDSKSLVAVITGEGKAFCGGTHTRTNFILGVNANPGTIKIFGN